MRILKITSEYGNDFRAVLICEHCGSTQELDNGYHDGYYHKMVIPAITCLHCKKNRHGDIPEQENPGGGLHV